MYEIDLKIDQARIRIPSSTDPERWLAAIVESSEDAIISETLDGYIASWNHAAERIFGYAPEEILGQHVQKLWWPGEEENMSFLLEQVKQGRPVEHYETTRKSKKGQYLRISLSLSPITDAAGHVVGIAKIARDITERTVLETSLAESMEREKSLIQEKIHTVALAVAEKRFRELIEHAPDGILQVDQSGVILLVNQTAEVMFGYSPGELLGMSVDQLVPATVRASHSQYREMFIRAGVMRPMGHGRDLLALRKDGSEFPVEISLSPLSTPKGTYVTAVIRDITERRQIEAQLRAVQESYMAELEARQLEADRLNKLKSESIAGMSHEIRSPLHTIIGFAELLEEEAQGPLNEAQKRCIQHIHRDSQHLLALINDVLDLSRLESGKLAIHSEPVSIKEFLIDTLEAFRPHAEAKSIDLGMDGEATETVVADPVRLRQILNNLLGNAIKFTSASGTIRVSAQPSGEMLEISVSDDGIGISEEEQSRIFERFYQVGYSPVGAGLGLTIARQLVEMQGGQIRVESASGVGSRFFFTLPLA